MDEKLTMSFADEVLADIGSAGAELGKNTTPYKDTDEHGDVLVGATELPSRRRGRGARKVADSSCDDERRVLEGFMSAAIREARKAGRNGDVPVGAIIVKDGEVVAAAYNRRESDHDATAHAETLAIRAASQKLGRWNLSDCDLYCTLEPCAMCAGAIVNSRIKTVVFGAFDPRFGCGGSLINLLEDSGLNHTAKLISGIKEKECSELMTIFFQTLRSRNKAAKNSQSVDELTVE